MFSLNLPQNASKEQKGIDLQFVAQFVRKTFFVNTYPLLQIVQKICLNKSKFSSGFAPFQTWLEK